MFRYILLSVSITTVIVLSMWCIGRKKVAKKPLIITLLLLLFLTALFDSLIIMQGIVEYNTEYIVGVYIGAAPIEDFFYTIVAVPLTITLWEVLKKNDA